MEQFTISLEGIELYGYHGLYASEKVLGQKYQLDIEFRIPTTQTEAIELHDTVDYKKAYDLITDIFKTPTPLLENICRKIAWSLQEAFPGTTYISVSVAKLSPPIGGISKAAKVKYELK